MALLKLIKKKIKHSKNSTFQFFRVQRDGSPPPCNLLVKSEEYYAPSAQM